MNRLRSIAALVATFAVGSTATAADLLYTLKASTTLPSTDTEWDYAKMQPNSSRLFIARDKDGLTVFDVDTNKVVATVENSVGANGPILVPEVDRGYAAMVDGTLLIFELSSLKVLERRKLDEGFLNSGIYEPSTRRVHVITGSRPKESHWYTLDAASGKLLGKHAFPFRKMDDPTVDGKGRIFAPARRDDLILVLDAATLKETARWPVGCNVSKVYFQARTNRVLGACLSNDDPVFFAVDAGTGRVVSRVKIGRGIDGFVVDEKRGRIVTSNGVDGTLSVIGQSGADAYSLLGTIGTRPGARMMHMDQRTGRLFVVNADYTVIPASEGREEKHRYHPNSFVVLTYQPD